MNMSVNTQRLTVSLPNYLYDQLMSRFSRGEVSRFISETVEKEIVSDKLERQISPVKDFLDYAKNLKLPKMTDKQIKRAINRGRE